MEPIYTLFGRSASWWDEVIGVILDDFISIMLVAKLKLWSIGIIAELLHVSRLLVFPISYRKECCQFRRCQSCELL
jgi:hypothetical protein